MSQPVEADESEGSALERVSISAAAQAQMDQFCAAHQTQVLTILLSDLEGSTARQSRLGNVRAAALVQLHRGVFRETLRAFDGQEVETAGDSFLVVFAAPSEGVEFALHMQAAMRRARREEPELPPVRVGLHQGQVIVERHEGGPKPMDIYGVQVSTAARIADLACGGQVLCSRAVFDDARAILRREDLEGLATVAWCNHGPYRFKGVDESYEVCEVGEEGHAPLAAPPAGPKGRPADQADEELGWRPAVGVTVPGTNWVLEERLGGMRSAECGVRSAKPEDDSSFRVPRSQLRYRGEFGEVWKAFNPSDKSRQVFKFCFKRDRLPALKREARLLKRLAKYRHPNLVEVYDVTEGDRPPYYLEMEYVEGPLLEEWLAGGPALAERLEIVAQAADALDTVHAAGIYHRDIKPSNILLTHREDGALLAKLSDFGLGAAEDQDLLRSISASRTEGVAGTWDYLAPELRGGGSASAQSDLYSLGVTLYQVAVGDLQRPLGDWEREVASEVLREDIRRCVATDPARRWGRAGDLARALRGHDQRARELRSRRRAARLRLVAGLTGTFALVVLLFGGYAWHQRGVALDAQRRERRARDAEAQARANADKNAARAKQEAETAVAVTVFLQNMLASASPVSAPAGARRPDVTVREVLDEAEKRVEKEELAAQPVVQAAIRRTIAVTYVHIGLPEKAKPHALKSVQVLAQLFGEEHDATLLSMETLGYVLDALGEYAEAEEIVRRAVAARERMHGKDDPLTLNALAMLGNAVHGAGKYKEAEAIRRRCFEGYRRAKGNNDIETLHALDSLAVTLFRLGKLTEAEQLHREALAGFQRGPGPDYPGALNAMNGLANVLMAQKKLAAAEQAYSDYLAASSRVYGKDHPHTATVMNYFGCTLFHLGRFAEAEGVQRDALAAMRRHWPEGHVEMFRCMCNLGAALAHQGKLVEARQHFEEALPGLVRFLGETHRDTVTARSNLESIRNALNKAPGREPPP